MAILNKVILVIGEDLDETREKMALIYEIIRQKGHNFSVLPEIISHKTTIARCRNLAPVAVFIDRNLIFKNNFGNLPKIIKKVCPKLTRIFLLDSNSALNKIICEELLVK